MTGAEASAAGVVSQGIETSAASASNRPALAIEAEGLTKVFRSRWTGISVRAVDGVSLSVPSGSTFGLLGPNGAGKTTFVKLLLSAVHPTAGRARIFGKDAAEPPSRRPIGYLPENHRFPTYFTGNGMLEFYGALSGLDGATLKRRIPELLDLVGLEQRWAKVRLGKYSKGMLQRLGLAQALLHSPSLLILDEPTDGVDPVGRLHIRGIFKRLVEQGVTIFLNSHQLLEVEATCDQVAILHQGQVALTGRVKDLTAGKGYRVTALAVPEALVAELGAEASAFSVRETEVEFQFAARDAVNQALDKLRAAHCEIESVIPTTSTLEEVFVKAVQL
jgi:ABC-2 type transport system ATP-binding protein